MDNRAPTMTRDSSQPKRIAVIGGGGASGLAVLRIFLSRPELSGPNPSWQIEAFESRRDVGGVWLPELPNESTTYPNRPPVPPTPLYNSLTTNLPHPLMAYHDFPFPPETALYPPASVVREYLSSYADHYGLRRHIEFDSKVTKAVRDADSSQWVVDVVSGTEPSSRRYDALIVANGHYGLPYTPSLPGLDEWRSSDKREIIHSIHYREPSVFKDRKLLIVGGGPSGLDLVKDSIGVARQVIHSTTDGSYSNDGTGSVQRRSRLVELRAEEGVAVYSDGTTDSGIEFVVLATGYTLIFPFLEDIPQGVPPPSEAIPSSGLACNGSSIQPLAQHTFPLRTYSPHTLAFVGLPSRLAPLPAADIQAEAIANVFLERTWDQDREEARVVERFRAMHDALDGNLKLIAQSWHKMFPGSSAIGDWDDYRADLLSLAGPHRDSWATRDWEREIYDAKVELRSEWQALEREGVAREWVKDVGRGGEGEWVDLMYRVLEHAKRRGGGERKEEVDGLEADARASI